MILKRCFLQWNGSEACSKGKSRAFVLKSNYVTIVVFFFPRMKRGTDQEALLLGTIMPTITCDIFPPADILNRILSLFFCIFVHFRILNNKFAEIVVNFWIFENFFLK